MNLNDKLYVFLINLPTLHHRLMANFLRKRGWVVFYLNEQSRTCKGVCWLELYQQGEKRRP